MAEAAFCDSPIELAGFAGGEEGGNDSEKQTIGDIS